MHINLKYIFANNKHFSQIPDPIRCQISRTERKQVWTHKRIRAPNRWTPTAPRTPSPRRYVPRRFEVISAASAMGVVPPWAPAAATRLALWGARRWKEPGVTRGHCRRDRYRILEEGLSRVTAGSAPRQISSFHPGTRSWKMRAGRHPGVPQRVTRGRPPG